MAYQRGSQINPALGMVDYSPIARGGEAMARGQMAGTQAAVGGAMQGLDGVLKGVEQYQKNKQTATAATAAFEGAIAANPELLQAISSPEAPPKVAAAFKKLQRGAVDADNATMLAGFAASYVQQKQAAADFAFRDMQARQIAQQQQDSAALASALSQFQAGNAPQGIARPARPFNAQEFMSGYVQAGGSPRGIEQVDAVVRMMTPQRGEKPPAGYEWKPDGSLAPIKGGPADQSNKPLPQKYVLGQPFVSADGRYLGNAVFDQSTSEFGIKTSDGKVVPIPEGATPATATSFTRDIPSINDFKKLKDQLTDDEMALRRYTRYLETIGDTNKGIERIVDAFTGGFKTFFNAGELNPQELALKVAQGQAQGLLGAARLDVVGGGVMTEQDAMRVITRLGGDVDALQSADVVRRAISELYADKYEKYKNSIQFYNAGVKSFYGNQGFQEAKPIAFPTEMFEPKFKADQAKQEIKPQGVEAIRQQFQQNRARIEELRRQAAESKK